MLQLSTQHACIAMLLQKHQLISYSYTVNKHALKSTYYYFSSSRRASITVAIYMATIHSTNTAKSLTVK